MDKDDPQRFYIKPASEKASSTTPGIEAFRYNSIAWNEFHTPIPIAGLGGRRRLLAQASSVESAELQKYLPGVKRTHQEDARSADPLRILEMYKDGCRRQM